LIKNTDYIKANAFAFYSINGNNFIDFMELSKAENVCKFLEEIVEHNQKKRIILILDNSKSHHADKTVRKARELKITLVFLPPYSPDLNPVEFVWKTIKGEVSVRFIKSKEQMKNIIRNEFNRISASLSFAKKWMEKFQPQIKSVLY
jgi:putative transposase